MKSKLTPNWHVTEPKNIESHAGDEGAHSQLWPARNLPRVQPVEESILWLVFTEEKVSEKKLETQT